ncbi:MAG TPA: thiolase family protein [Planctomycetota bacterium]|nr:thiolase family protein [Planctomycetota bacterium]
MNVRKVGIVDFARSPIAKAKGGALNGLSGLEIAAQVVKQLLARNPKVPQDRIEHLALGVAFPEAENGLNIARQLVVKAGLPISVAGTTVNQFCASSQQTTMLLHDAIALGKGDIAISVGLEHMTRVPMGGFNPAFDKELYEQGFYMGMGETAENLAKEGEISREAQEAFSVESHKKAIAAWTDGAFAKEVVPIALPDGKKFERDECPQEPNLEKIKSLKPAFDANGTITAATSSPVTVGAAAMILMAEETAKLLGIPLRATFVTTAVAGCDPKRMGMGPLPATAKALGRADLTIDQIDAIELNEAFAAQSLYVINKGGWEKKKDRINVLGGAIALGHPLGMSGVRIIGTTVTVLEKLKGKYGLATMCVGGGQGAATILERA